MGGRECEFTKKCVKVSQLCRVRVWVNIRVSLRKGYDRMRTFDTTKKSPP